MTEQRDYHGESLNESVDAYLSSRYNGSTPFGELLQSLDLEQAKKEAKKLHTLEEEIAQLLKNDRPYDADDNHSGLLYEPETKKLGGLGNGKVKLIHFLFEDFSSGTLLGVHSPNNLIVYLHTDLPTLNDVRKIKGIDTTDKLSTEYFFDRDGNFGKLVYIPEGIKDNRKDAFSGLLNQNRGRTVNGQMSGSDFELAGRALELIKEDYLQARSGESK